MAKQLTHKTRALKMLEALGWTVADVEQHVRHSFTTIDLFGFADLLAIHVGQTLALQVTSPDHVCHRVDKVLGEPRVFRCLLANWQIEVWGVRDEPAGDGSLVLARTIELHESGRRVIAFEGSEVLGI